MTKEIKGSGHPEISVDRIMAGIRSEAARRRGEMNDSEGRPHKEDRREEPTGRPGDIGRLDLGCIPGAPPFQYNERGYHLNDFLKYHDQDFINNAYFGILKRRADTGGLNYYLENLRSGNLKKVEILGRLRYSAEGRGEGVRMRGLLLPFVSQFLYKIPLFGYLLRLLNSIARLPVIVRNAQNLDAYLQKNIYTIEDHLNSLTVLIQNKVNEIIEAQKYKTDRSELEAAVSLKADRNRVEDVVSRLEGLDSVKISRSELEAVALKKASLKDVEELVALKADHDELEKLRKGLKKLIALRAKRSEVNDLISSLERLEVEKSDRSELEALASQKADLKEIEELGASKADRVDVESLASQMEGLSDGKADRIELESALSRKVDHAEIEELAALKADRNRVEDVVSRLEGLDGEKVNRSELEAVASQKADRIDIEKLASLKAERNELENLLNENSRNVTHISYLKQSLVEQERRLGILLEETRKCLPEPLSAEQLQLISDEEKHLLDAFFVSFTDEFRGTQEDIRDRAKIYLPVVKKSKAGTKDRPILDLGCGRGEWLQLLKNEKLVSRGLDINRVLVEQCRERGLDVFEGDMVTCLRDLPDSSLGAITGFHVVEHIDFKILVMLFDESLRVLKPGGVAIFETPNPQNVIVGSYSFYVDPTHNKPLPSQTLRFLAEMRGFSKIEILELHPSKDSCNLEDSELAERFNKHFYGPQDYALVGWKS